MPAWGGGLAVQRGDTPTSTNGTRGRTSGSGKPLMRSEVR